uniref:Uncharacterized protein n=1 Tax=Anguilla anguilla TaxID=7936 RepID=A0A0E9V0W8_ANGAN
MWPLWVLKSIHSPFTPTEEL